MLLSCQALQTRQKVKQVFIAVALLLLLDTTGASTTSTWREIQKKAASCQLLYVFA
jgi:hypothetical protein